ncbi:FAD/NAD(P)-binding domain-containing protein [Epithele typhae]|uniref:FAD/NAD(P)-binding domain-containing protein n=1 Tax=Epithele typhae TaxID=378194 RepID=UPI0020086555|nr:FAD/NAD(P)-binding domain-containing protein [Epithele typhae]KAH9935978.1 FAD/NAD(P)-binding domain-containing protein [Epithele typhae]
MNAESSARADLALDILVVGGGISGLALAYTLSTAGHRVRVLEKSNLSAPSGGIRLPPNFSKILKRWIGEEELMKVATRCVGTPFMHLNTGSSIGYLPWRAAVMAETGGDFLVIHDLLRLLHRLATDAGAIVEFNTPVSSIHPGTESSPNPSVTLVDGRVLSANVLVGADGNSSQVRPVVLGYEEETKPGGLTVYTGVIDSTEDMLQDSDLRQWASGDNWPIWMGSHRSLCAHPIRAKKGYFFHIWSHTQDGLPQGGDETWNDLVPTESTGISNLSPELQRMVRMAGPTLIRTQHLLHADRAEADWVDSTGRIVLIGDAAHPSCPGGSHTGSMGVEDAVVLGALLARLRRPGQLPTFLSAYQELRQARAEFTHAADLANARLMALAPGPVQQARDESMARHQDEGDEWDEGATRDQFNEIAEIFVYDAYDAAEEWWVNWGRFSEVERERDFRAPIMGSGTGQFDMARLVK